MIEHLQKISTSKRLKQLADARNIGLYIFGIVVLAITWSAAKTVQSNYELQKQISALKQQNEVLELQNENIELKNKYLESDQYLELSARQSLGLAAPGEKVLLVPERVALKHVKQVGASGSGQTGGSGKDDRPGYVKNMEDWRDFLLGRNHISD